MQDVARDDLASNETAWASRVIRVRLNDLRRIIPDPILNVFGRDPALMAPSSRVRPSLISFIANSLRNVFKQGHGGVTNPPGSVRVR